MKRPQGGVYSITCWNGEYRSIFYVLKKGKTEESWEVVDSIEASVFYRLKQSAEKGYISHPYAGAIKSYRGG